MNQTESLYLFGNIKSLEDLKYFPNLKVLSLSDSNRFKDIFYYSGEAESLSLNNVSGIRYAGGVEELQVFSQNIGDLSILKALKKLKKLELKDCTFSNPEVIGECISLTELDLWRNSLRHLGFLEHLVNLKKLNLLENDAVFSEYKSLGNLSQMENLTLYNSEISHIEFVRNMPDLRELRVIGGRVSDISPLSGHEKLESIVLDENKIKDLSTLEDLERLKRLSINDNYVLEISSLEAMRELRYLSIQNNKVTDISPLKNLPELSVLYLGGNPIEDISFLPQFEKLTTLSMDRYVTERISDIMPLLQIPNVILFSNIERKDQRTAFSQDDSMAEIGEVEIRKRKGVYRAEENYAFTNTLLRNGILLIQETYEKYREGEWFTVTRYYGYEDEKISLLQTNQYNCGGESYLSNPDALDRVIMANVKEGNRKEYLLEYDESDIRLESGIKVPVVRDCPPDVVVYGIDRTELSVGPDGFSWNYMVDRERKRAQNIDYDWKPSAKSPKEPLHPLSTVGAPNRSIESLPVAGTQEETQKETQKEVIGNIEYYLDCDVIPDRLIVYEWLFRVKIEDGLYYQQPWPDSQTTLDLTHGMPVTLSLKPERLYEIVAVWDGENLEKNGFSGEAQYLLETKAVQGVN